MAARQKGLSLLVGAVVLAGGLGGSAAGQGSARGSGPVPARRIVSLVPALTEMLFAIGAGPQVVAVSSYDDFPPEVKSLAARSPSRTLADDTLDPPLSGCR